MNKPASSLATMLVMCGTVGAAAADEPSFAKLFKPLVATSCLDCHDADTETDLNLESLSADLSDAKSFRSWEKVFDRVRKGEMPPESVPRPEPAPLGKALAALAHDLRAASLARQRQEGRVPARRLTKLEFGYTLRDLLQIDGDVTGGIPDEVESGSFDTVGATQRISAVHMESYLKAADQALGRAIRLGRNPYSSHSLNFNNSPYLNSFHEKPLNLGGNVSRRLDDGVALFRDVDYLITSFAGGFHVVAPGVYKITSQVATFQSKEPITLKMIRKQPGGGAQLLTTHDLVPGQEETLVVTAFLQPGDTFYTTFAMKSEPFAAISAAGGAKKYKGPGIAIKSQKVEGPLSKTWPPPSTRELLRGLKIEPAKESEAGPFRVVAEGERLAHVREIAQHFAQRVFRRPALEQELEPFVELAKPALQADRELVDVIRIPLRSMLSSPQFLLFGGRPGKLDDYALAARLSYFLWKSIPDESLWASAKAGKLSDPQVLSEQVERMLADDKSQRFVRDFLGQWLRLNKVNATTPDDKLYPEYDELLGDAIPREPELFFAELIESDLSLSHVIDSDFTFVNRRLAEHYGISNVAGQQFRKVALPGDSPRGGMLTQAGVLKTTANGTVTSPVTRGNFVLTSLLGTPPSPPPPSVGSIEPDTRGQTTIREILAAHRDLETCAKCHREIDPPGFALESFDPIGGFRTHYRANAKPGLLSFLGNAKSYRRGPKVDPGGITADGKKFSGIQEFKQLLLERKKQVARHFISQLVVYSTGGEIQFADRDQIEAILERTGKADFRVKQIIHEVVQSTLFRNQ